MSPTLVGLGLVGLLGLGYLASLRGERTRNLGIVVDELRSRARARWARDRESEGADDLRVELSERGPTVVLSLASRELPRGITLERENLLVRMIAPDVVTGDWSFDEVVRVVGPESKALALLDAETRTAILSEGGSGDVRLDPRGVLEWRGDELREAVDRFPGLLDLASRLREPRLDPVEALARNATEDPVPGARRRNLEVLQKRFPGHPLCREACRKCLGDGEPELRFLAADLLAAGPAEQGAADDAEAAADVLAELAASPDAPRPVRLGSLRSLSRPRWRDRAVSVLREASRDPSLGIRREAIEGFGRLEDPRVLAVLLELLDEGAGPATAAALAEALGGAGTTGAGEVEEAEEALLGLLDRDAGAVRRAAIEALGRVGSARAVEPLLEIADSIRPRESRTARKAVDRIQLRLGGAQRGELSLTEPKELDGALSPSDEEPAEGAVSLAPDD